MFQNPLTGGLYINITSEIISPPPSRNQIKSQLVAHAIDVFCYWFFFLSSSYLLRNAYVVRRLIYKDEKQCRPLFKVAAKNVGQRTCVKW